MRWLFSCTYFRLINVHVSLLRIYCLLLFANLGIVQRVYRDLHIDVCFRYFEWHRGQDGKKQPYFFYPSGDCGPGTSCSEETCTSVSNHGKTELGNEGKENVDGERESLQSQPCTGKLNLLCVSR